jgi:hypothetical protein
MSPIPLENWVFRQRMRFFMESTDGGHCRYLDNRLGLKDLGDGGQVVKFLIYQEGISPSPAEIYVRSRYERSPTKDTTS